MFISEVQKMCNSAAEDLFTEMLYNQGKDEKEAERIKELVMFFDSCGWALYFGGNFQDEIFIALSEVLEEEELLLIQSANSASNKEYDQDWKKNKYH